MYAIRSYYGSAIERALIDQIRALREHPVGEEELEKVKSQILTQELRDRQTSYNFV